MSKKKKHKKSKSEAASETTAASGPVAESAAATEAGDSARGDSKDARKAAKQAEKLAAKEAELAAKQDKVAAKQAKAAAKQAKADEKAALKADKKSDAKLEKKSGKKSGTQPETDASAPTFKHVRRKKLASGKGPTPQEIGESLVALFNAGKSEEAESTWYHRKIESIEDDGSVFEGWKGVLEKGAWWKANFTVLSMQAKGPYVCSTGFTVIFSGRVRMPDGTEVDSHECGVYTVEKGRIVREQFMRAAF
ncbi:MAG: SnoaL-like domain-containing protein [Phycisphaerales bacterium]